MINNDFHTITKVVGVTYENESGVAIQSILPNLKHGENLFFIRDYHNQYDENAIKVYSKSGHIGHLSKELAAEIAPFLSEYDDYDLEGRVIEITGGDGKSSGCNIEIWVENKNISSFEDINSNSTAPREIPTQNTETNTELIAQSIVFVIVAIFVGILCFGLLGKIWWFFYVFGVGAFAFATYMLNLIIKISKK
ncbi:MAG: HIRAN domain-containing protein [Clostridia bacterium]|nr:HIRAN domain-containing protein [Clostridia bacterium]